MPINVEGLLETLGKLASEALTETLCENSTVALEATVEPAEQQSFTGEQWVWFGMNLDGSLQGRVSLALRETEIVALRLRDEPSVRETTVSLLKVLQGVPSRLQQLAGGHYGKLTATVIPAAGPAAPDIRLVKIIVRSEGTSLASFYLCVDSQVVMGLQHSAGVLFPETNPASAATADNLGLVLDVELSATLRFGQRQLALRDILDLTSGSVVELDRQVDEPVELILDGRVIARGEAVIIDGNYGMRITEVLQPVNGLL